MFLLNPNVNVKYSIVYKVADWSVVKPFPSDLIFLGSFTVGLCDWDRANHRWRMETLRKLY